MKIDLSSLFNGSVDSLAIDKRYYFGDLDYCGYYPLKEDVSVKGKLFSKADAVHIFVKINYTFFGFCDRCAENVKKDYELIIKNIVVNSVQNDDNDDDYIIVKDNHLDIEQLVREEIVLNFPSKLLCSEDCKGLCPKCGANLNVSKCGCKPDVDPRMSALLQLLD